MPLLYYWVRKNDDHDRAFGFGYQLNQNSPAMREVRAGESLWAFTTRKLEGWPVLAAGLRVRQVTRNRPNYLYGRFRVCGDLEASRYFDVDVGPNAEPLIRALGITARARNLGQSFQGPRAVRPISDADHRLLANFAHNLPVLDRVGIYPEDQFEERLVHGTMRSGES